ncbi:hypothetical protein G7Y79_00064g094010 [Physcia stellaris]|nr:hypothetical protein G7Y79_00064g094010 [Physcia stellaris]
MPLLALPNELLVRIIDELPPDGFEAFALANRELHSLAGPTIVRHNFLKRQWNSIAVGYTSTLHRNSRSRVIKQNETLLRELTASPAAPKYVQVLRGSKEVDKPVEFDDTTIEIVGQELDYLIHCSFLSEADVPKWRDHILAGKIAPIIAMLLARCLNLKILYLMDFLEHGELSDVVNAIASSESGLLKPRLFSTYRPLSALHTLYMYYEDIHENIPLHLSIPFLALPSMRRLVGYHLEADHHSDASYPSSDFLWPYDGHSSNVRDVEVTDSAVSATHIRNFLQTLPHLRSLKWQHCGNHEGAGHYWNGGAFLKAVCEEVGPQLEKFCLTTAAFNKSLTALDSFKGLSSLRYLEFSACLLVGEQECGVNDKLLAGRYGPFLNIPPIRHPKKLFEILPATLERLRLLMLMNEIQFSLVEDMFDGLDQVKQETLPLLTEVTLCCKAESKVQRTKGDLERAGVQVVVVKQNTPNAAHAWDGSWDQ